MKYATSKTKDNKSTKYVVSQTEDGKAWYCHMEGFPYVPVFGSIGSKQKAMAVCRERNQFCKR